MPWHNNVQPSCRLTLDSRERAATRRARRSGRVAPVGAAHVIRLTKARRKGVDVDLRTSCLLLIRRTRERGSWANLQQVQRSEDSQEGVDVAFRQFVGDLEFTHQRRRQRGRREALAAALEDEAGGPVELVQPVGAPVQHQDLAVDLAHDDRYVVPDRYAHNPPPP